MVENGLESVMLMAWCPPGRLLGGAEDVELWSSWVLPPTLISRINPMILS